MVTRKNNFWVNLGLLLMSFFLAFLVAEIFLRIKWINYWRKASRSIVLKELAPNMNRKYSRKNLFAKGGYITIQTDEDGFMLPNFIDKQSNQVITLAFLGASTLECFWIEDVLRFPYLVGKEIANTYNISTKILNSGGSANTTHHSLNILLNKTINYNPDVVIMMHAANDAGLLLGLGDYKTAMIEARNTSVLDLASRHCYLLGFLRHIRAQYLVNRQHREMARRRIKGKNARSYRTLEVDKLNKALKQFSTRLKIFIDIARDINAMPVLMTQPYYRKIEYQLTERDRRTSLAGINYIDEFNKEIREIANLKRCKLIDLEKELERNEEFFYDHLHYSEEGSQEVAAIISKHLKEILPYKIKEE
jgi:lysophospholipase L1-like esterase